MIPKIIHYCWFGRGEKPKLAKKCIESWKKYCPDYDVVEWNEDNYDVHKNPYTEYCYQNRKWAYLSDFVRLDVVAEHGGIYFDTDVELLRSPDFLLDREAFFCYETPDFVATGLGFGAQARHRTVTAMRQLYLDRQPNASGAMELVGCPRLNTQALQQLGFVPDGKQAVVEGAVILPADYMNPMNSATGTITRTNNTFSIHRYTMSAQSPKQRLISTLSRPLHRLFGADSLSSLKKLLHMN